MPQFFSCKFLIYQILLLVLWISMPVVFGQENKIFKSKDEFGQTTYSDEPSSGGEEFTPKEITSFEPVRPVRSGGSAFNSPDEDQAEALAPYESLTILEPKNGDVIRDNAGNLAITVNVAPSLRAGHVLQLMMDGKPHPFSGNSLALSNIDRGTHQLRLKVIQSESQQTFQDGPVSSVTLLRHSIQHPKNN